MPGPSRDDRAQTPSDYLIGISLLLVTILGVFAFVPTIFAPFEQPANADDRPLAEHLGDTLIANHTMVGAERTVDLPALKDSVRDDLAPYRRAAGLPGWKSTNVTVLAGDERLVAGGTTWNRSAGGISVRTVRSYGPDCEDGCRLIVRVWS